MKVPRRKLSDYLDRAAFRAAPHRRARCMLVDCYLCGARAGSPCLDSFGQPFSEKRWSHHPRVDLADLAAVMECIDYPEFQIQSRPDDVIDTASPPVTEEQSLLAEKARYLSDLGEVQLAQVAIRIPEFGMTEGLFPKEMQ